MLAANFNKPLANRVFPILCPDNNFPFNFPDDLSQKILKETELEQYRKILTPHGIKTPKFHEKGLILVWPTKTRNTCQYRKEIIWFTWIVSHTFYWLNIIGLFPTGTALPLIKQPPVKHEPPPRRKPENRDYIIEPDCVSVQVIDSDIALLLPNGVYQIKEMEPKSSRLRKIGLFCLALAVFGIIGLGYFCPDKVCALSNRVNREALVAMDENFGKPLIHPSSKNGLSYDDMLNDDFSFDMDSHDVMVFLHMQKTGGTSFGKHLVHDLDLKRPCTCPIVRKRCYCFRPHSNQSWLFSRYTTGWKCGLHADWTELTGCVDEKLDELEGSAIKRRYFYITLMREPIARYLSEFRHVQRGATWKGSRHFCKGRAAEVPPCYEGDDWEGVSLDEFIKCDSNLASNRQTRMLADLELVGCYDTTKMSKSDRERTMLISAKRNLESMAFFGLTEHQKMSQYIFEETFNLRFAVPFEQNNATVSSSTMPTLTPAQAAKIASLNSLDIELYKFAREVLFKRFDKLKARDADFQSRFSHLGELPGKGGVTEFDWDRLMDDTTRPSNPR